MSRTPNPAMLLDAAPAIVPLMDAPREAPPALLRLVDREAAAPAVAPSVAPPEPVNVAAIPTVAPSAPAESAAPSPPAPHPHMPAQVVPTRLQIAPAHTPASRATAEARPVDRRLAEGQPVDRRLAETHAVTRRVADGHRPSAARPPATRPPAARPPAARPTDRRPADRRPADRRPVDARPVREHAFPGVRHPVGRVEHGAVRGLVHGLAHGLRTDVPIERTLIENAQREPTRFASDLAIYRHDPERYRALEREDRLPSRVWWRWGEARIPERLAFVHREHGAELERRYRERPTAERAILGLAAGTGHMEEVERALDALRRRHDFPRRASFRHLVEGLPAGRISQIAAGFLTGREAALEAYRRVRRDHEREETEKRLRLLRELLGRWGHGGIEIVPIFERLSARHSPAQQVALRRALEARDAAAAEALFQRIEAENAEARTRALEAAFVRFAEEWEGARDGSEQTPMQELSVPPTEPPPPIEEDPAVAHLQAANPTVPAESLREWVESLRDRGVQIGLPGEGVPAGSVILSESEREDLGDWPFEMAGAFAYETADADEAGEAPADSRDAAHLLVLDQANASEPSDEAGDESADEAGFIGRTTFVGEQDRFAPGPDRQFSGRWGHKGHGGHKGHWGHKGPWGHEGHKGPWGSWKRNPYHYGHRWATAGGRGTASSMCPSTRTRPKPGLATSGRRGRAGWRPTASTRSAS